MSASWGWALAGFGAGALLTYLFLSKKITELSTLLSSERMTQEKWRSEFRTVAADSAEKGFEGKKDLMESYVREMKERLQEYEVLVKKFEGERFQMYGNLEKSLQQVLGAEQQLRMETASLKRALTSGTGVRGRWGEKVLQEILERSELVAGISFETQVHLADEGSGESRPDFIIKLPSGKKIVIDSKEVSGEYVLSQETDDPDKQKEHTQKLVANIRNQFIRLSRKEYQAQSDPEVPFVVMFIPSEGAIRAAFSADPNLFQEATQRRVILASPMTIIPLLWLVAQSWREQSLAENAREIGSAVEELGSRLYTFVSHLKNVGVNLQRSVDAWNGAMGSWQSRVTPQIEKSKALGGKLKEAEPLETIDTQVRQ